MPKISKIMDTHIPTLKKEARISDVATLLADNPQGCVIVVEGKKPIGVITESDIVRNLISKKIDPKEKVTEIMSSPVTAISHNSKLEKANKIINTKHFRRYPVVENEKLVGVITENVIVSAINDNIQFHRNIQNAVLVIFVIFELFIFVLYRYLIEFFPFLG
jgi:CBS domain-containing protein|tara:strand:- start:61 stop:546 length:486 start_codon:yes stop_codon:yes gene_type:complete